MRISRRLAVPFGAGFFLLSAALSVAAPPPALEPLDQAVCRLIEDAAHTHRLPVGFLTRLIWRESSFRAGVVSRAGAEGIAQFRPGTARERGLADPFDPEQAIPEAAELLAELRQQFGSLGVAAAAYNAGPARVATWLRGEGGLPAETRLYVRLVTERTVEEWSATGRDARPGRDAEATECVALVATLRRERGSAGEDGPGFAAFAPWGVQLAGNFSKNLAVASFERARRRYAAAIGDLTPMVVGRRLRSRGTRPFYQVRLPAASRVEAAALCARIQATGGACVALRS